MLENKLNLLNDLITEKKCYHCKEIKLIDNFSFNNKKLNIYKGECKDCCKRYYELNKTQRVIYQNIYRFNNIERENNRSKKWNKENAERYKANQDSYRENNKEKIAVMQKACTDKKKEYYIYRYYIASRIKDSKVEQILTPLQNNKCLYCLKKFDSIFKENKPEINHFIPLSTLWEHSKKKEADFSNVVVCCAECRGKKRDKEPLEYFTLNEHLVIKARIERLHKKLNDLTNLITK